MGSKSTIIYGMDSSHKSYYEDLYKKIKAEFARRKVPTTVNKSNMSQFLTSTFNDLENTSDYNDKITYNHVYLTINQLINGKKGKINTNSPIKEGAIIPSLDDYIELVETFAEGTQKANTKAGTGCNAICIGMCFGACYGSCNGCSGCTGVKK